MAGDALKFADDDADELGAARHFDLSEFLDRDAEGPVLIHPRDVVHAIGVGDVLVVWDALADLLGTAVQVAQVGHGLEDEFAVSSQDDTEHAVCRRVLRPHVDEHFLSLDIFQLDARRGDLVLRGEAVGPQPVRLALKMGCSRNSEINLALGRTHGGRASSNSCGRC